MDWWPVLGRFLPLTRWLLGQTPWRSHNCTMFRTLRASLGHLLTLVIKHRVLILATYTLCSQRCSVLVNTRLLSLWPSEIGPQIVSSTLLLLKIISTLVISGLVVATGCWSESSWRRWHIASLGARLIAACLSAWPLVHVIRLCKVYFGHW